MLILIDCDFLEDSWREVMRMMSATVEVVVLVIFHVIYHPQPKDRALSLTTYPANSRLKTFRSIWLAAQEEQREINTIDMTG